MHFNNLTFWVGDEDIALAVVSFSSTQNFLGGNSLKERIMNTGPP